MHIVNTFFEKIFTFVAFIFIYRYNPIVFVQFSQTVSVTNVALRPKTRLLRGVFRVFTTLKSFENGNFRYFPMHT